MVGRPPVGVAVIGAGYWGRKFISEYLSAEQKGRVRLIKVYDPSIAALGALLITKNTAAVGQGRLTQKLSDVMNDSEITAVHIASPNPTHYGTAKMALEAGKNVLIEKPMTLKPAESFELVDLARKRGLVIEVGHIFRFNDALQHAKQIVDRGDLGKLFYIRIQWTDQAFFPDRDIIFDLGPHPVDILNQLLGNWPLQLSGISRSYRGDGDEVAYVIAEFPNDIFAHIELSWLHPKKVREVTIVGSTQTLVVDCLNQHVFMIKGDTKEQLNVSANNTMEAEIDNFIDRIIRSDTSSDSGLIGARTVEVLDNIRTSTWNKPLPELLTHSAVNTAIGVLRMAGETGSFDSEIEAKVEFRDGIDLLLGSGLIRRMAPGKSASYELTEAGYSFLKAYHAIGRVVAENELSATED